MRKPVESIREIDEIKKVKQHFVNVSIYATRKQTRDNARRNLLLFTIGINTPLKPQELISLKWTDIIDGERKIKQFIDYNGLDFYLNNSIISAVYDYLIYCEKNEIKINMENYIFSTKKSRELLPDDETYRVMLVDVFRKLNIEINVSIESLRKTFVYWQIKNNIYNIEKLIQLQKLIGHGNNNSLGYTMNYAGYEIGYNNIYINDICL